MAHFTFHFYPFFFFKENTCSRLTKTRWIGNETLARWIQLQTQLYSRNRINKLVDQTISRRMYALCMEKNCAHIFDLQKLEIIEKIWKRKNRKILQFSVESDRRVDRRLLYNIEDQTFEWISKLSSDHGNRGFRHDSNHQMIVIDRGKWWVSQTWGRSVQNTADIMTASAGNTERSWPRLGCYNAVNTSDRFQSTQFIIPYWFRRDGSKNDGRWKERDQPPCRIIDSCGSRLCVYDR